MEHRHVAGLQKELVAEKDEEAATCRQSCFVLSHHLLAESTGHALDRIATAKSWNRRIAWMFVFFAGFGLFIYEIYQLSTTYLSYSVSVTTTLTYTAQFEFPAVTVCNMNMLRKSRIGNSTHFAGLAAIDRNNTLSFCTNYNSSCSAINPNWQSAFGVKPDPTPAPNDPNNGTPGPEGGIQGSSPASPSPPPSATPSPSSGSGSSPSSSGSTLPGSGSAPATPAPPPSAAPSSPSGSGSSPSDSTPSGSGSAPATAAPPPSAAPSSPSGSGSSPSSSGSTLSGSGTLSSSSSPSAPSATPAPPGPLSASSSSGSGSNYVTGSASDGQATEAATGAPPGNSGQSSDSSLPVPEGPTVVTTIYSEMITGEANNPSAAPSSPAPAATAGPTPPAPPTGSTPPAPPSGRKKRGAPAPPPPPPAPPGFQFSDNGFSDIASDTDFASFMEKSKTQDYSDLVPLLKPSSEELYEYGTMVDDFILQCSFDHANCTYQDFELLQNSVYGNCYTFKPDSFMNGSDSLITSNSGSQYGLRLSLNIQYADYIGLFAQDVGVRVSIHPFDVTPFPESDGVSAAPGMKTQIGVTMTSIERLPTPYPSNCTDVSTMTDSLINGVYTVEACETNCVQKNLLDNCYCVDQLTSNNVTRCQISNTTQEICRQEIYYQHEKGLLACDCPPPCHEIQYEELVSVANWPSDPYLYILGNRLMNDNPKAKALLNSNDLSGSIKQNIVRLHIYIKDVNVFSIVESPAYALERLMSDIGGVSGLFLGFSALSMFEFVEYFIDLGLLIFSGLCFRKPTMNPTQKMKVMQGSRTPFNGGDQLNNIPALPNPYTTKSNQYQQQQHPKHQQQQHHPFVSREREDSLRTSTLTPTDVEYGSKSRTSNVDLLQDVE